MSKMSWEQRLRNAMHQIKFSQQPGTHDNGEPRKKLSVADAMDELATMMGVKPVNVKPLYKWFPLEGILHSNVSGKSYTYLIHSYADEPDKEQVIIKYGEELKKFPDEDSAVDFIAEQERQEPPVEEPHPPIQTR